MGNRLCGGVGKGHGGEQSPWWWAKAICMVVGKGHGVVSKGHGGDCMSVMLVPVVRMLLHA